MLKAAATTGCDKWHLLPGQTQPTPCRASNGFEARYSIFAAGAQLQHVVFADQRIAQRQPQKQAVLGITEETDRGAVAGVEDDAVFRRYRFQCACQQLVQLLLDVQLIGYRLLRKSDNVDEDDGADEVAVAAAVHGCSGRPGTVYLTRMPGWAPESGDRMNRPGASPLAASTMPSDMPNFILRGARFATITVSRPTSVAGS